MAEFGSFSKNPQIVFANQEPDEKVILLLRAHLITLVSSAFVILILAGVPLAYFIFWPELSKILVFLTQIPASFQILAIGFWYLVLSGLVFWRFLLWYFNVYILTNKRIVDFDFHGIFFRAVSEAELEKVQDVTAKTFGAVRTLFNFGDVIIQTAGEFREFDFLAVPKPDMVSAEISAACRKENAS